MRGVLPHEHQPLFTTVHGTPMNLYDNLPIGLILMRLLTPANYYEPMSSDGGSREGRGFEPLITSGFYQTTEAEILKRIPSPVSPILEEEGLRLVREACDELEEQVA